MRCDFEKTDKGWMCKRPWCRREVNVRSDKQPLAVCRTCCPGTELKKVLLWFGISPENKDCKCLHRAAVMDVRGLDWCQRHKDIIVDWLMEAAKQQKKPCTKVAAWLAVTVALYRTRRKELKLMRSFTETTQQSQPSSETSRTS